MSPKAKVYLETTIPSYLTAWPSRDLIMAANQEQTREWWENHSSAFELFVSQTVIMESSAGDSVAAQRRLEFLKPFPRLDITVEVEALAVRLIAEVPLPPKAQADALHIAVAAVNRMNYLLTWNCTHIAHTLRTPCCVPESSRFVDLKATSQRLFARHKKCWYKEIESV